MDARLKNIKYSKYSEEKLFDETKLRGSVELYGSFIELYSELENYVNKMLEIHEINLKEVN